jgi:hypothetical protein
VTLRAGAGTHRAAVPRYPAGKPFIEGIGDADADPARYREGEVKGAGRSPWER